MDKKHYTLALNMIVGAGDGEVLDRCLSAFDCHAAFDEIVIVMTTNDPKVKKISKKYATLLLQKQWTSERYPYGDFAGARNLALDNTKSDYIMWLDADDVLTAADIDTKMKNLRNFIDEFGFHVFFVNYCLERDDSGNETWSILRERIWRKDSGVRWVYPCHEQLPFDWSVHKKSRLTGVTNIHSPMKLDQTGVNRNIKILEHEYMNPETRDQHIAYYYGRDISLFASMQECVPIFADLIQGFDGNGQNIFESAIALVRYYLYEKIDVDGFHKINARYLDIVQGYCNIALSINDNCAEPYVYLGDVFLARNKKDEAAQYYKKAMQKEYGNGMVQQIAYYEAIPASRLSAIYIEKEEFEQALWYNKLAKDFFKKNNALASDRHIILKKFIETEIDDMEFKTWLIQYANKYLVQ
jgi:glycosyltransferase involved in cell wall biosynthesis